MDALLLDLRPSGGLRAYMPAFAFANEIIPVFSRKPIFGYPAMVAATVGIGFMSLGVWAHHMFTIGMTSFANAFFTLQPCWSRCHRDQDLQLAGHDVGRQDPVRQHRCCSAIAFLFQFLIAGLTGIMLSVSPFDWQLDNSYFVVAHFHYVLIGGMVFIIFAALYYWYPKVTGRMFDERWANGISGCS